MNNQPDQITFKQEPVLLLVLMIILLNLLGNSIYWCYLLIPLFLFYNLKHVKLLDINFFSILLFSALYPLCLSLNGISFGQISGSLFIGYFLFPPVFYLFGKYLVKKYPSKGTVYFMLFLVCIFFSILPFIENVRSVLDNGFMSVRSIQYLVREEEEMRSATITGGYFAINMTLLPLIFTRVISDTEKKLSLVSIILFCIGLFSILNMSNRTGLFIMVLSLISFFIITRKRIKSALILVIFIVILIILYIFNVWGLQSWFEHSRIFFRLAQTSINEERSRYFIWFHSCVGLIKYPFGFEGFDIGAEYAHNLWLDVGRKAGFIPLVPLLIFTFTTAASILKISFSSQYSDFFKVLIAGFGIGFLATFFVEPAIEGFYIMFFFFCFYAGLVHGIQNSVIEDGSIQQNTNRLPFKKRTQ